MTLFTSLVLLVLFKFNLFQQRLSLTHGLQWCLGKYLPDEKIIQPRYFWAILFVPAVSIFLGLFILNFLLPYFFGSVLILVIWVGVAYLCFNHRFIQDKVVLAHETLEQDDTGGALKHAHDIDHDVDSFLIDKDKMGLYIGHLSIWVNYRYIATRLFYLMFGGMFAPALLFFYCTCCFIQDHFYKHQLDYKTIDKILFFLDWLPTRLISCSYLLTGHFTRGAVVWMQYALLPLTPSIKIILSVSEAALLSKQDLKNETQQYIADTFFQLSHRTSILVLVVIALFTIVGILR
tara:strand:+ start:23159 stop:24031 length:873 start_codon:yes stop_codon:yes gene_type:complete